MKHEWKGNIRELRNYLERAVLVCEGSEIEPEDLGLAPEIILRDSQGSAAGRGFPELSSDGLDLDSLLEDIQRRYMEEAYLLADGNESSAARLLNMNHHTFRYRRKKLQKTNSVKRDSRGDKEESYTL